MSNTSPDPRFLGGEPFVLTDTRDMAVAITITHDGVLDARCHVPKALAAKWLHEVAALWERDVQDEQGDET